MTEEDLKNLIQNDTSMMRVLHAAENLNLPDWWIGAGFLRNKIWDSLEGVASQPPRDIDLVYYNLGDTSAETDYAYDEQMKQQYPFAEWEVRNQARMHVVNDNPPYSSTADGIAHWVETATCIAIKLVEGELQFLFCYGKDDLMGIIARPTPFFETPDAISTFYRRVDEKGWVARWPHLQITAKTPRP